MSGSHNLLYSEDRDMELLMYQLDKETNRVFKSHGGKMAVRAHKDRLAPVVSRLRAKLEARKAKEKTEL